MSGPESIQRWPAILFAAAVAVLLGLFLLNGRINGRSHNDAEALQDGQRALIAVSELALDQEPIDGQMMNVHVSLVNKGRSTALDVTADVRLAVLAGRIVDDWDTARGKKRGMLLPDTTAAGPEGFDASVLIGPGTMALYNAGTLKIWISGRITYSDALGQPHWTNFCAHHTRQQSLKLFTLCDTGNEVDGER